MILTVKEERVEERPQESKAAIKPTTKRDDIQGLRALAIVSVFVYHLNARRLPFGYLGVDMFFVISGFLMAMILSPKGRVTWRVAADFYFRRLKRILPTYLVVVLLTLGLAAVYVNPMDRLDVVDDARAAIRLYSNLQPLFQQISYFQLLNNYAFFAHTWSLCVEMQFYLVVPLLFALLFPISGTLRFKFCSSIAVFTFFAQLLAPPLFQHSFTPLRMWQFMVGIMTFYSTERSFLPASSVLTVEAGHSPFDHSPPTSLSAPVCVGLSILVMLLNERWICVPLARLLCTFFAAAIIQAGATKQSALLTNRAALWIGDHSYTIYLVHWPAIVFYKYLFGTRLCFTDAAWIVVTTLLLTLVLDWAMDAAMRGLTSRTSSIVLVLVLYLMCVPLLGFLSGTAKNKKQLAITDEIETHRLISDYYRGIPLNLSDEKALEVNGYLYGYAKEFKGCTHRVGLNASRLNTTRREVFVCREEGQGTKNALLIGNSLARHAFVGIAHHFRPLYRTFQLHAIENCSPFRLSTETEEDCHKYADSLEAAFREFRPDVIFIVYRQGEIPFAGQNDEILVAMRSLYALADRYATDLVFTPAVEIRFRIFQPMDAVLDALRTGVALTRLRMSRYNFYFHRNRPFHWQRVLNATCSKCVLVDWSQAFSVGDWLMSVDVRAKLTHFIDRLHVSDVGSFHVGLLLRRLYDSVHSRLLLG